MTVTPVPGLKPTTWDPVRIGAAAGRGLQRVVGPLTAELAPGEHAQLVIDQRQEAIEGAPVPGAPFR